MALKANKGEWSELYVLVTLLAEGILFQSDMELNKDYNNIYEIIKAYKSEVNYTLEFEREEDVKLFKIENKEKHYILSFSLADLKEYSSKLFLGIKGGKGSSFSIIEVDDFLSSALISKIKADSSTKADIKLKIYDHRLAKETDFGFSIKSLLGGDSTLFNTGAGNNFIYEVENKLKTSVTEFNKLTYKTPNRQSKITYRLLELQNQGCELKFNSIQSKQLWKNLDLIEGHIAQIIAVSLYYRWIYGESSIKRICELLEENDPLNFYKGEKSEQKFYNLKLKKFLAECAMGMTSEKPWHGQYDSFGGVIIAKEDGDLVCFHIYDFNLFRDYLFNNTFFEQASTGEDAENPGNRRENGKKYYYGWLYEDLKKLFFKINLQIRFK